MTEEANPVFRITLGLRYPLDVILLPMAARIYSLHLCIVNRDCTNWWTRAQALQFSLWPWQLQSKGCGNSCQRL